jgi:hypothetical protein
VAGADGGSVRAKGAVVTSTPTAEELWADAVAEAGTSAVTGPQVRQAVELAVEGLAGGDFDDATTAAALGQLRHRVVAHHRYAAERAATKADDQRVEAPIIVIGPARAGTTLAHELLALDPEARGVRMWEIDEPVPPPGRGRDDERVARTSERLRAYLARTPGLLSMHPYFDDGGMSLLEDDAVVMLELLGSQPFFDDLVPVPYLAPAEPIDFYEGHRRILNYLQVGAPPRHWALKGVFHTDKTATIREVYPDARFVWCHRDPVKVFPSIMQIVAIVRGDPRLERLDLQAYVPMILESFGGPIRRAMDEPCSNDDGVFHLHFSRFVEDQAGALAEVYEHFGETLTAEHRDRIQRWVADPANDPNRHGRIRTTPEQFGLTAARIDEAFGDYMDRYGIERERD